MTVKSYTQALLNSIYLLPVSMLALGLVKPNMLGQGLLVIGIIHFFLVAGVGMLRNRSFSILPIFISLVGAGLLSLWSLKAGVFGVLYVMGYMLYYHPASHLKRYGLFAYLINVALNGPLLFAIVVFAWPDASLKSLFLVVQAVTITIAAMVPLVQLYEINTDEAEGLKTIAVLFGIKRILILVTTLLVIANVFLLLHFFVNKQLQLFYWWLMFFAPVAALYRWWAKQLKQNPLAANEKITRIYLSVQTGCMLVFACVVYLIG